MKLSWTSNTLYKTSSARTVHWQRMPGSTHQELWHLATYFWTWTEGCQDHQFVHDSRQNSSSPCLNAAFDRDSSNQASKFQPDSTVPSSYCYDKTTSGVSKRLPWECCDTSPNSCSGSIRLSMTILYLARCFFTRTASYPDMQNPQDNISGQLNLLLMYFKCFVHCW